MTPTEHTWFDLASLQLVDSRWQYVPSVVTFESASKSDAALRQFGPRGRYIAGLNVWVSDTSCLIEMTPKGDPRIGCRGLGSVLDLLVQEFGVGELPRNLFLKSRDSLFLARSLLSLWPLGCAERRNEILSRHTLVNCPREQEEGFDAFETRAVQLVASRLEGYEELDPGELRLKNVLSTPDGLFYRSDEGKLVIVEAKMNQADWSDGAAQVLQYIGQARNNTRFCHSDIATYLVVADDEAKEGYRGWQDLMRDDRELNIYIDATCLAFADAIDDRPADNSLSA